LNISVSEDVLPNEDRIKGKHISDDVEKEFENVRKKILSG
jgi:hypothetical protein